MTGQINSIELTTDVQRTEQPAGILDVIAIENELKVFPSICVHFDRKNRLQEGYKSMCFAIYQFHEFLYPLVPSVVE